MELVTQVCDASMPKKRNLQVNRKPVYLWAEEIADLPAPQVEGNKNKEKESRICD